MNTKMLVLNRVSRYDVARVAIEAARKCNPEVEDIADRALQEIEKSLDEFWNYIKGNGKGESISLSYKPY